MLNRRTLRIKVMQTLFAYEQHKNADNLHAVESIELRFSPDLNSMDYQDREKLLKQKKEVQQFFDKKSKNTTEQVPLDPEVHKAVKEAEDNCRFQSEQYLTFLKKDMAQAIEKINSWYYSVLGLLVAFAEVAKAYQKTDHSAFINHPFIRALNTSAELKKKLNHYKEHWNNRKDQVLNWFRDAINTDPVYLDYICCVDHDLENQKAILKHLVRKRILNGTTDDYFIEQNIRWTEDYEIIRSLVDKTIKSFDPETHTFQFQQLSLDGKNDLIFMEELFEKTVRIDLDKKELIAKNTKNWEIDRIPLVDRIILEMAVTEFIHFPEIPIKVSINEYIELAKRYSTPKSPKFVNGILDVLVKKMQQAQIIKKSGKGLIDNQ